MEGNRRGRGRIYTHTIDGTDRIESANEEWFTFAAENDAPELTTSEVVGRPIWDFIDGAETRHLFRVLIEKVRAGKDLRGLPFRCDSPGLRRYMEMDIVGLDGGGVRFDSVLLREEHRVPVRAFDRNTPRSERFLTLCSWCRRIRIGTDRWLEVEEAVKVLNLFGDEDQPQITHGICKDCNDMIFGKK